MITGSGIRSMRNRAGLTQQQLAKKVGVSQAHIAKIEGEKVDPRLSTVNRIISVLEEGSELRCSSVMTKKIICTTLKSTVRDVSETMRKKSVSQLPVMDGDKVVGTIDEKSIIMNISEGVFDEKVSSIMSPPLPIVDGSTPCSQIKTLLEHYPAVLVSVHGALSGIISRSDLFKAIGK